MKTSFPSGPGAGLRSPATISRQARWRLPAGIRLLIVLAFVLSATACGFAQNVVDIWQGGNGNWSQASNWNLGVPNGPGITANIGTGTGAGPITGTVTVDIPVNLPNGISLGNDAPGSLVVSSAANTVTAGTLDVGFSGPGSSALTISNGGKVTDGFADIGVLAGA